MNMNVNQVLRNIFGWAFATLGIYEVKQSKFIRVFLVSFLILWMGWIILWILAPKIMKLSYDWDQHKVVNQSVNQMAAEVTEYIDKVNVQARTSKELIQYLQKNNESLRQLAEDNKKQNKSFLQDMEDLNKKSEEMARTIEDQSRENNCLNKMLVAVESRLRKSEAEQVSMQEAVEYQKKALRDEIDKCQENNQKTYENALRVAEIKANAEWAARHSPAPSSQIAFEDNSQIYIATPAFVTHQLSGPQPIVKNP